MMKLFTLYKFLAVVIVSFLIFLLCFSDYGQNKIINSRRLSASVSDSFHKDNRRPLPSFFLIKLPEEINNNEDIKREVLLYLCEKQKNDRYRTAFTQEAIQEQVMYYLKKKLGAQEEAAKVFGLRIQSVNRMWAKYKEGNSRLIQLKKRGIQEYKGYNTINGKPTDEVQQRIKNHLTSLVGPFNLWTRAASLQGKRYDIEFSVPREGRRLHRDYALQKPIRSAARPLLKRYGLRRSAWQEKRHFNSGGL